MFIELGLRNNCSLIMYNSKASFNSRLLTCANKFIRFNHFHYNLGFRCVKFIYLCLFYVSVFSFSIVVLIDPVV